MSKGIKVSDAHYDNIRAIQGVRESYDDVIGRMLAVYEWAARAADVIGGNYEFRKWQAKEAQSVQPAGTVGGNVAVSDVPGGNLAH